MEKMLNYETLGNALKAMSDACFKAAEQQKNGEKVTACGMSDDDLDINHASVADFMTLPGIGASKAEALVSYREAKGGFSSIEDIMNVDGIKKGVFDKIKDRIKVN